MSDLKICRIIIWAGVMIYTPLQKALLIIARPDGCVESLDNSRLEPKRRWDEATHRQKTPVLMEG
jgi:hypothetical protein